MVDAVLAASKGIRRDFGEIENLQVSPKGTFDFVTSSDLAAEKKLISMLGKARPDWGVLSEEAGEKIGSNPEYRFIIDPIDGTSNFMRGIPYFCISLGLERRHKNGDSEVLAGVIYDPLLDELYWAERGFGAYLNHRRLRVSRREKVEECIMAPGSPPKKKPDPRYFSDLQKISALTLGVRCTGSAALDMAYVAAGRYDAFYRRSIQPWDIAAGIILVQEAGGRVTEVDNGGNPLFGGTIMATNGSIHSNMVTLLK